MTSVPTTYIYKSVDGVDIEADVFLPLEPTTKALIPLIWIHGGGMVMSNRTGIAPHLRRSPNTHGTVMISVDYRLCPQVSLVEALEDVVDSIGWVRSELPAIAAEKGFNLDLDKLVVSGGSAGGYLAMLSVLPVGKLSKPPACVVANYPITSPFEGFYITPHRPLPWLQPPGRIITEEEMKEHLDITATPINGTPPPIASKGPIPFASRGFFYDYLVQEGIAGKVMFLNAPEGTIKEDYDVPKNVSASLPPLKIFHSSDDTRVDISQSENLVAALDKVGATYTYEPTSGTEHLFDIFNPAEEMEGMYTFIKSVVG